jgi:hypothetical protein
LSPKSRVSVESSFEKSGSPFSIGSGSEDFALSASESLDSMLSFRAFSLSVCFSSAASFSDFFCAVSKTFLELADSLISVLFFDSTDLFRSPARHSQHPLNKSLDLNKSVESKNKTEINESANSKKVFETAQKKSENEAADEKQTDKEKARKLSIESKDSDADSAKSSLPDPIENGLPDFSKEDSTDTLDFGDKLSDLRDSKLKIKEPTPALSKTDEGYVSAEKVQNDNAQEILGKQRDNLQNLQPADKLNLNKSTNRLSTEDSIGSQELPHPKPDSAWPQMFGQASANIQQQMLENQRSRQQKQDITNSSDIFAKSLENLSKQSRQGDKKVADAIASQQQQQYEAFFNQMFNMQRKTGPEISQQQMAYAQQAYQAYQYQYLQQMQAYGLKVPDQDFQLMLMHAQQQEANWYQQQLGLDKIGDLDKIGGLRELEKLGLKGKQNASTTSSTQEQRAFIDRLQTERIQEQRKNDEKRISEEKRKQEERRQQDEKKRLEEKQRKEDLFRQEEMKRQEEKRKKEEEEQKKKLLN